jgi:hypothetical protein
MRHKRPIAVKRNSEIRTWRVPQELRGLVKCTHRDENAAACGCGLDSAQANIFDMNDHSDDNPQAAERDH